MNDSDGPSTVREPSLQSLIPATQIQWNSNTVRQQNFGQRMFEHYQAHNPATTKIQEDIMATMDFDNQAAKSAEAKITQAMKDKMDNLVEMLRKKTNQRRSSQVRGVGVQQGSNSPQSSIEDVVVMAGNQQNVSVTDVNSPTLQQPKLNGQSQKLGNKDKQERKVIAGEPMVLGDGTATKKGGIRASRLFAGTAKSLDMTHRTARGGTQCNLEQIDTDVGALFYNNVIRRPNEAKHTSNVTTQKVGQPYKDLSFTNTVVINDKTQKYNTNGGKVFMQRPASQNASQRILPLSQRQIQSQLAFIKPGTTMKNNQQRQYQDARRIFNTQSDSDGQMNERTSESDTENRMRFLARSIKPNYANLHYIQKQMKLNKNWSSRPSTSNVLLGSCSIGDTGNFVLGRTCAAITRKPATDFIIKNKESVASHNQTQLVLNHLKVPTMATVTTKRKSLNHTPNICNEKRKTKAANNNTIPKSGSRSRTRSLASPRDDSGDQKRKSSPLGVSSRLQRADFRIKRGDKKRRQKMQSNSSSKNKSNANTRACSTNILVSASTFKEGRGRRETSANSLNKSINDRDQMDRSQPGSGHHSPLAWAGRGSGQDRRSSANALFKRNQSQLNMKKSRHRTARDAIQNPTAAQLPASIQQQSKETLNFFSDQKRSGDAFCSRNCQQHASHSSNQVKFTRTMQRGQTGLMSKMFIQEEKRHTLIPLNKHQKSTRQIPVKIEVQQERIETIVPPITDVNDNLTGASYEAAHEKYGMTQYRHGDYPSIFQESVIMNIDGVETDQTRQQQIDDKRSNCYSQVLKAKKHLAIEVGSIQMPAATNREGSRDNQHCRGSVEADSHEWLATSRGYKCGQCTDCINATTQGVSLNKVIIAKMVGNSNRQKLEVLKPKWVGNVQLRQVPDDAQMVFKLRGPELFEKQMPMLITACKLLVKRMFKAELRPLDHSTIASTFFMNHVYRPQLQLSVTLQALSDKNYGEKLYQQMMVEAMLQQRARGDFEMQAQMLVDQIPLILVITAEDKEINEMNELQTMITAVIQEDQTCENMLVEPQSQQLMLHQDNPQRTKADQIEVFDPEYAEDTIITQEWFRRMELTCLVVYQFQSRIGAYLQKRAHQHRQVNTLYQNISDADFDQLEIQSNKAKDEPIMLDFLELDEITEPRTRHNRAEIYKKASEAMPALIETYRELDIMTAQIEDTAFNTDYQALEKLNNKLDDAFDIDEPRQSKLVSLKTNFADFFEQQLSDPDEVRARTEVETNDKFGQPHLNRICPSFVPLFQSLLAPERMQHKKYRSYAETIFVLQAPLPNPVDNMANLGLIEKHYEKAENRRTRKQHETEIYCNSAFPLASETVNFQFLPGVTDNLFKSHLHYLADMTEEITTYSLEYQQAEVEELNELDESKHARLVQGYQRRLHPVEHLLSQSSLHAASFYREEFALPALAFEEEEKYCELAARCEILEVYPLISSQNTPWFDKSRFHQQVLREMCEARRELTSLLQREKVIAQGSLRETISKKNRDEVKQRNKDHYRATIRQLYRKNLILILERENQDEPQTEKVESAKLGSIVEEVEEEVASSIMSVHPANLQVKQEQTPTLPNKSSRASLNDDDSDSSLDDVQFRITMRRGCEDSPIKRSLATESTMRQVQAPQIEETKDNQIDKEIKITEESKDAEPEDLSDLLSDSDDEGFDVNSLQEIEVKTNHDYVVSDDDDSSDDDYVGIKLTNTSYGLHKALMPCNRIQNDEQDNLSSDEEEEQKLDALIISLAQQEAPATSIRDDNIKLFNLFARASRF